MKKNIWQKLLVSIVICQVAGGIGALATTPKIGGWYAGLQKPFFGPPNWLFGPVWTILFVMMGISLYFIWIKKKTLFNKTTSWFWIQLGLNILWSFLFFGMESPILGLVGIFCLWGAIYKTIKVFGAVSKTAGNLLVPYLAWVSFATLLNVGIFWLNR